MPTMGAGAIESGGLGGNYTTTQTESSSSNPLAPGAVAAQQGQQGGISSDYQALIQQALNQYNPNGYNTQTKAATPGVNQAATGIYDDNLYNQYVAATKAQQAAVRQYTNDPSKIPEILDRSNWNNYYDNSTPGATGIVGHQAVNIAPTAAEYRHDVNSNATALQNSQNSLGNISNSAAQAATNTQNLGLSMGIGSGAYAPYMQTGAQASQQAASLAGLGDHPMSSQDIYNQYLNNPAVQAQMQQGNDAINSNYGAKGLTGSSALMKSLNQFGQGVAAQTIGNAQQNLYQLAGQGANAANQYASNLLSNYNTNINAQLQGQQNQNALLGTAASAANAQGNQALTSLGQQSSLMGNLGGNQAQLATQASLARMNTLAGSQTNTNSRSTSIAAPILETSGQTMAGMGAMGGGSLIGTLGMAGLALL